MIIKGGRFDQYAYRVAEFTISDTLLAAGFEDGTFVSFNSNGELVKADGTKKAFMMTTSKKPGRDLVTGKSYAKGQILMGAFIASTDQVDSTATFAPGKAVYVNASGVLDATGVGTTPVAVGYALSDLSAEGTVKVYILP